MSDSVKRIAPGGDFELIFGDPVIVAQGEPGREKWGYMQFPTLHRAPDGRIVANWEQGSDDIYYAAVVGQKISADGSRWEDVAEADAVSTSLLMPNGRYFEGFVRFGAHEQNYLHKYTPAFTFGTNALYFRDDIAGDPDALADTQVLAREYDPKTGEITEFSCRVNWPHAPLLRVGELVYPYQMIFALSNRGIITVGDVMYQAMYFWGFDSFAKTREEAVLPLRSKYSLYVFKSEDSGRTWDLLSQVCTTEEHTPHYAEGVCEPEMTVMPDGSFVMLMRTGSNNPSYMVRSTDNCRTWSDPVRFDSIGVMPQILSLECGVTLAGYGRPEMRFRATSDPTGLTWQDPITVPTKGSSCHYTDLIPLSGNTALWIYADGGYRNAEGQIVKSIVTRTVTVVPK